MLLRPRVLSFFKNSSSAFPSSNVTLGHARRVVKSVSLERLTLQNLIFNVIEFNLNLP